MPMLQEQLEQLEQVDQVEPAPDPRYGSHDFILTRKLSEESIRTEFCEGPIPDSPKPKTPEGEPEPEPEPAAVSDRAELIERLKRGESPTWVPSRRLESLFQQATPHSPNSSPKRPSDSPTLLPPATITPEKNNPTHTSNEVEDRLQDGLNIDRPKSALHRGDFRHDERSGYIKPTQEETLHNATSGDRPSSHPWLATSPPRDFAQFDLERRRPISGRIGFQSTASSLSSSLSQSFAYKPPTSPLVQSQSNDELVDLSLPMHNIDIATGAFRSSNVSRRHTLHFSPSSPFSHAVGRHHTPGRETSHPYQAHQPRRSLTSTPNLPLAGSSPQTPGYAYLVSRRRSISSDASPVLHASMVGSYEESILRGRMSTTPSKPLDFLAEIGVLGQGKCKPSLKCPAHVTVPFSAVFYSYASTTYGRTVSEDGPSPYVGQIDLENGLSNTENGQRSKRKIQSRYPHRLSAEDEDIRMDSDIATGLEYQQSPTTPLTCRKATPERHGDKRPTKRSKSPKAPPGGSYRIPEKGMLQIIIKNQNKTAVKLFLINYDLAGMEPGTKTFVRQRSYSDPEEDAQPSARPILRYLIQLHICCLAKGRYYLYKSIRVVFANRVPDGKEKLRNEVTYPEPRFSPYKPTRVMLPSAAAAAAPATTGPGALLAVEKAFRRRSSGFSFVSSRQQQPDSVLDGVGAGEGLVSSPMSVLAAGKRVPFVVVPGGGAPGIGNNDTVDPIPFHLPRKHRVMSDATSNISDETRDSRLPRSPESSSDGAERPDGRSARYDKLNKGDVGYGGNAFAVAAGSVNGGSAATEGLLSRCLRSLGVQEEEDCGGSGE